MTSPLDTGSYDSDLVRVLRLEDLGNDAFCGPEMHTEVFHRTFGGHLVAQALEAATRTVSPEKLVHSLHAYFLAPADADRQTTYRVRRHRDGRSFASRSVEAFQGKPAASP
ncbi:acyl-CoA thioesterase [Corynebacterium aquatimens]|uniref:acyl-CoA thioesterase n=1 Tax=Corynebacterium aquatimens TaxID=1190508 RepID=UPI00331311A2